MCFYCYHSLWLRPVSLSYVISLLVSFCYGTLHCSAFLPLRPVHEVNPSPRLVVIFLTLCDMTFGPATLWPADVQTHADCSGPD